MNKNEREAMVQWREYLAGPCVESCPPGPYDGHKHYSTWYDNNRSTVVGLNHFLLEGWDLAYFARLREMQPTHEEIEEENREANQ